MTTRLPVPVPAPRAKPERAPAPPAHLGPAGKDLWQGVQREYALDETHQRALLQAACEARDRQAQARDLLATDGIVVAGRDGPKQHPAVVIERDARVAMARCLRELGLDLVKDTAARPPSRWS